ncbi:MAG: Cyanophycin synthetase [Betaproteobacteria bacterium ADurb.Bin341]|nr:MAG: Cyanophycin synthetase [Betaproteobacteria bacterium ADurb.Bin341]
MNPDQPEKNIRFLRMTHLRGPNLWTYRPVLEAWVDIGALEDYPSNMLPGLYERLSAWLPGLIEHRCGVGERGGFLQRVREGTWAAHILEHVTIELQNLAGMQTGFGKARATPERGIYKVAVRARQAEVSRKAITAARDLVMAAIEDRPFDVAATVGALHEMVDDLCLGPSTACIVDAARERRIPHIRLTEGNLVQLGYSKRQRRIWTAETDRTSAVAESISRDKDLTKRLLSACGVPVPEGREVHSPEDAWAAAREIGLPVVVKPSDGNHGRGVFTNLRTQQEVESAFNLAHQETGNVMVERFVRGDEHRVLVVGGKLVAAIRGDTAKITGDGRATVAALVASQINSDPRRGESEDFPLEPVRLVPGASALLELERQGLTPDSVPEAGREILVIRHGNMAFDVTDAVHPEVAAACALAARIVGLDVAGIDLVAQDIGQALEAQGGAIVEVNAGPSLLMHLRPAFGKPRPVGQAIVDYLFPANDDGRIPLVGITGSRETTLIARLVAWLFGLSGLHVGLACRDGLFFDHRLVEEGDQSDWEAGQRVLMNRSVEAGVFEQGALGILRDGLPYDRCLIGVVTDAEMSPGLFDYYVRESDQRYTVLRTQVDVVLPEGKAVLNAEDELVAGMSDLSDGEVVFYGQRADLPALLRHREGGGAAVYVEQGQIVLARGKHAHALVDLASLPVAARNVVPALLAAVAVAWAFGLGNELIVAGLDDFSGYPAPGTE